jgi:transposase
LWLLDQIEVSTPKAVGELEAVRTLRTVWAQRYERGEGGARLRVKTVDCTELIVTPHDPGVRAGEKRGKKWRGEKAHLTETAEAGGPNFITDVTTANASSGDVDALPTIRQRLAERGLTPAEQYVDAGYVSGKQLAASQEAGIELLGPPLADTSPQEFKIADFTVDQTAKQAICPEGQRSVKWSKRKERDGSAAVNIQFAAATCRACPSRARCTSGQGGRSLQLSEHYPILEARRLEAKTEAFRQKMRARPAIEATLSELVRKHGMRRHRYRGEAKRHFENLLKAAACNLKRLTRALVARWEAQKVVIGGVAGQAGVMAASP